MAQEVIRLAVEAAPLASAAASFATGRALLAYAQRDLPKERKPHNEAQARVNEHYLCQPNDDSVSEATSPDTLIDSGGLAEAMLKRAGKLTETSKETEAKTTIRARKPVRESFMGRVVLRSLPFMCAAAGYLAADTVDNEKYAVGPKPLVTIVADRSGATEYGTNRKDDTSPATRVTNVLEAFKAKQEQLNTVALLARGGKYPGLDLEEALTSKDADPFGDAPMRDAYEDAVMRAKYARINDESGGNSAAVVVLTNGNIFTRKDTLKLTKDSKVPVSIINVSDDNAEAGNFKEITRQTKGVYWNKNAMPEEIVDKIKSRLEPTRSEEGLDLNLLPPALLFAAGLMLAYRESRLMPRTFWGFRNVMKKVRRS